MALAACWECKKEYSTQAKACVHCGARNPSMRTARDWIVGGALLVAIALGLLILWGASLKNDPQAEARMTDQIAVEECRKQQNDELSDVSTRRFLRDACDQMEANYREKWGHAP